MARSYMFKRKEKIIKREIEYKVELVEAKAMRIVKNGTYVLSLSHTLPTSELDNIIKTLKKTTEAKWIIVQGAADIVKVN